MRLQFANTAGAAFFACSLHVEVSFIPAKNEALEVSKRSVEGRRSEGLLRKATNSQMGPIRFSMCKKKFSPG
jgi:hypothetical protein